MTQQPTPETKLNFIPKIGLSGGIASGKSSVAAAFAALGVAVINADQIARDVVEPGMPALLAIAKTFGTEVLDPDGGLDRAAMRAIVFAENGEQARLKLEAITHPAINAELTKQAFAATGPYVVMELPLLVEKQNYEWLDRVLIVDTTEAEQLIRLERRSNIKGTQASAMLAAQASRAERLAVADDVFENHGNFEQLNKSVAELDKVYRQWAKTGHAPDSQQLPAG